MNNNSQGVGGNTSALIHGSPDIKPNGKYNTPPMVYVPGGPNGLNGKLLAKALEDYAIRENHTGVNDKAGTIQLNPRLFENDANQFIDSFFNHHYPNRTDYNRWNSAPVRKALYNLQ